VVVVASSGIAAVRFGLDFEFACGLQLLVATMVFQHKKLKIEVTS